MTSTRCPTLLVAAPASGQGKTTVTAAMARLLTRRGKRVRVFKCGPDFLDPQWHALASGHPVHNLDLWLNGEDDLLARLHEAAGQSDLILIEGVMGLFDGDPSAADLAIRLGLPVLAVIDASAMAGTFGAVVHGLRHYRSSLRWAGVLANRVAGAGHAHMLQASVQPETAMDVMDPKIADVDAGWLGALPRSVDFSMPERHLGLTLAGELPDAMKRLDALADALAATPLGQLDEAGWQRWSVEFNAPERASVASVLVGRKIAVARDAAFCFIYQANLDVLQDLGAQLRYFSPLTDSTLPDCDALWLPGGYPELHADTLQKNTGMRECIRQHAQAGKPIWAECGGMMALFDALVQNDGTVHAMWGVLPGRTRMQPRLARLGPQQLVLPEGVLRGHTFHYSLSETLLNPAGHTSKPNTAVADGGEAVYQQGAVRASYFHPWFASNPAAAASLFMSQEPR